MEKLNCFRNQFTLKPARFVYEQAPEGPKEAIQKAESPEPAPGETSLSARKAEVEQRYEENDIEPDSKNYKRDWVGGKYMDDRFGNNNESNPYLTGIVPAKGIKQPEGEKIVCWRTADPGDSVETVMANYKDLQGRSPIEAKQVNDPRWTGVIVKWQTEASKGLGF